MRVRLFTLGATALAMIAFAADSILCRLALGPARIDAAGFTAGIAWGTYSLRGRGYATGETRPFVTCELDRSIADEDAFRRARGIRPRRSNAGRTSADGSRRDRPFQSQDGLSPTSSFRSSSQTR